MGLKYEDIAKYLPFRLKVQAMGEFTKETEFDDNPIPETFLLNGLVNGMVSIDRGGQKQLIHLVDTFPILRPFTDLKKEFINEYEVNFIENIYSISWMAGGYHLKSDEYSHTIISKEDESEIRISILQPHTNMWWVTQEMFKWHFDVGGLIPQKLAIDINTINN